MRKTSLPTWITRAPKNVGSSKVGKLSADQWRVTCTIHLPVTLIRLWAKKRPDTREYKLLLNFLELVQAAHLSHSRIMTSDIADQFQTHLHRYLTGLQQLFPNITLTPYQHLCLHLPFFFKYFGPTHSWRCFAFERCNYVLQRINTNSRFDYRNTTHRFHAPAH
ncbi:hypothetical protein SISNIDRAFT_476477 [Sistotremastrum niveocremeum HHB9708]|uniref:DUF4218 domain-containing protein n=1 Tax=Sistotremastrum niveocremeum HHB9708 TaxID=1314777 RepID=A0A164M5Y5_9AGAM|nr:hypothetical protein SISNIDRAFT_476477 [Sistotremastrum niveocremeum HHB9708]